MHYSSLPDLKHSASRRAFSLTIATILSSTLAACGGGSSSGSDNADGGSSGGTTPPPAASFSLSLSSEKLLILQGTSATVTATLTREAGFTAAVEISLTDLPTGVSAGTATVAAGATSATLAINAAGSAPHSLPTTVTAKGVAGSVSASKPMTVTVRGLPGVVDTSFAGGKVITPVGAGEDIANVVLVQSDGKVVMAGSSSGTATGTQLSMTRYLRDGGLDASFGTGGKVFTAFGTGTTVATAMAQQVDGKLLVAGYAEATGADTSGYNFALARYNLDGSLDASFGTEGKVVTDFNGKADIAYAISIQADGKIVLGGHAMIAANTSGVDFALARYNSNGTLDASFGTGGKVTTSIKSGTGTDSIKALALQTVNGEQRILAVGGDGDFVYARYLPNGNLDPAFAGGGKVASVFNGVIGEARAVTLLPDGKAVLAGHSNHSFAAIKLNLDGSLDASFGSAGKLTMALISGNWAEATAIVRQADGKLLVGGWVNIVGSSADFAAMRLSADGALDNGFGIDGTMTVPMASGNLHDRANGLALQADDRVPTVRAFLGGQANTSNFDFALARLWL